MELLKAEEWLFVIVENSVLAIYLIAAVVIIYGTFEAAVGALKAAIRGEENLRQVGVNFGRWLITGLSFMLAADILGTMIETDWEGIGRLAAVAAIRTFLNYFLERDMREMRERDSSHEGEPDKSQETE